VRCIWDQGVPLKVDCIAVGKEKEGVLSTTAGKKIDFGAKGLQKRSITGFFVWTQKWVRWRTRAGCGNGRGVSNRIHQCIHSSSRGYLGPGKTGMGKGAYKGYKETRSSSRRKKNALK